MVNYRNSHTHLTGTFAWYVAAVPKLTTCVICFSAHKQWFHCSCLPKEIRKKIDTYIQSKRILYEASHMKSILI